MTAPVESVLVFYRGQWKRPGPASMPHQAWLKLCGPRGMWRFPGTSDAVCPAPFPEQLPERCITLFSFPDDVIADPFVGCGAPPAAMAARLSRVAWASDRDPACVAAAQAWVVRERASLRSKTAPTVQPNVVLSIATRLFRRQQVRRHDLSQLLDDFSLHQR